MATTKVISVTQIVKGDELEIFGKEEMIVDRARDDRFDASKRHVVFTNGERISLCKRHSVTVIR